ncbi:MAG: S41 family peptidase [Planctomycetota bacterium]
MSRRSTLVAHFIPACLFTLLAVGSAHAVEDDAATLSDRGRDNLLAFARLVGDIRHFHPSDEAARLDWDRFVTAAVSEVESAADAQELAAVLRTWFEPIAPSIRIELTAQFQPTPHSSLDDHADNRVAVWTHAGFGQASQDGQRMNIYSSKRRFMRPGTTADEGFPSYGETIRRDLPGGITTDVPIAVLRRDRKTIPAGGVLPVDLDTIETDGTVRTVRFASVILLWNVMQHFYPYFDVVDTDWDAILPAALDQAAMASADQEHLHVLQRMVAALHDGHGSVWSMRRNTSMQLPFDWTWAGEELVITHAPTAASRPLSAGDVVMSIDGQPTADVYAQACTRISGATEGWKRHTSLALLRFEGTAAVVLELRRPDGSEYTAQIQRVGFQRRYEKPRGDVVRTLDDGVMYVDLDQIKPEEFKETIARLVDAPGVVFDMRGYPTVSPEFLYHVADEPVRSANWNVPLIRYPDQRDVTWSTTYWPPQQREPRIESPVVWLTDGRAISYAESCMAIVEHYELGPIVGATTAGTNGNVNPLKLPGGYQVAWTGMKVTTHDDGQYHGVGVKPTHPCEPTVEGIAAGRDDVLERGLEVLRAMIRGE